MEKSKFVGIEAEVRKAISKYKWELVNTIYDEQNFGNWLIEFQNPTFKLRLVNDRGDIRTEAYDGTEWQPGSNFFELKNIETVSKYLTENSEQANEDIFQFLSQILMNLNALNSINFEYELNRGRIPLFLEREEIEFLCNEWLKIPTERLTDEQRQLWGRIVFKGQASLHKKGIYYKANSPDDSEKYK